MKKIRAYLTKIGVGKHELDNQVDEVTVILPDNNKFTINFWTSKGDAVIVKPIRNSRLQITPGPVDKSILITAKQKETL